MRLPKIVTGAGAVLVAATLVVGLWPVSVSENVGFPAPHSIDDMPIVTVVTVDCGSPILKSRPVFEGEHSGDPITYRHDPCALVRDHRLGPVKDLGTPGVALVALGVVMAGVRRRKPIESDLSGLPASDAA